MVVIVRLLLLALLVLGVLYLLRRNFPNWQRSPLGRMLASGALLMAARIWLRRYGIPLLLQLLRGLRLFR